ncbi:hypothetical protein BC833DRAFT_600101 [Globomyces pollinis-pini]|nr:hypothetical protein BC833DRAFT_600101 [Globomyces pollinis-pini]
MNSQALSGTLSKDFGKLQGLSYLDLSFNTITGTIPDDFGNLSLLQYLDLGANQLTGSITPSIGKLLNLQFLSLNTNQLSGTIPNELLSCKSLNILNIGVNEITGSIPIGLSGLTKLTQMQIGDNLMGTIPKEFGDLKLLEKLWIKGSGITGGIPDEIKNLPNYSKGLESGKFKFEIPIPKENGISLVAIIFAIVIIIIVIVCIIIYVFQKRKRSTIGNNNLESNNDKSIQMENGSIPQNSIPQHSYPSQTTMEQSTKPANAMVDSIPNAIDSQGTDVNEMAVKSAVQSVLFDSRLIIKRQIAGSGGAGRVYKAVYSGKNAVAKIPLLQKHEDLIYKESQIMQALVSPWTVNVLQFMSNASIPIPDQEYIPQAALLIEFMNMGTFAQYLNVDPPTIRVAKYTLDQYNLVLAQTLPLTIMAAKGVEFIHSMGYNHLDIKPQNILLHQNPDRSIVAKVSDFGSALPEGSFDSVFQTDGFVPPEGIPQPGQLTVPKKTSKFDIYAFGGCLINIIMLENYVSMWSGMQRTSQGRRSFLSTHIKNNELLDLIMNCMDDNPESRPTASQLVTQLETFNQKDFTVEFDLNSPNMSILPTMKQTIPSSKLQSLISNSQTGSSNIYAQTAGSYLFAELKINSPAKWTDFAAAFEVEFDTDDQFDRELFKNLVKPSANRVTTKILNAQLFKDFNSLEVGQDEIAWIEDWYHVIQDIIVKCTK